MRDFLSNYTRAGEGPIVYSKGLEWLKKKKKCDYQQKGCITDKEGKDFTILLRITLFIIISKWENGKRSIHMLKDYLDLQLSGEYPSKLFSPPFSPLSTFYLTPNVSPKVFFNWKAMA